MKRFSIFLCFFVMILGTFGVSEATSFRFQPNDGHGNKADLWDLSHGNYYEWGIHWNIPAGEKIVGASLFFDNIRNYNWSTNDLWVHLLDDVRPGTRRYGDSRRIHYDNFTGRGLLLEHYHNLPRTRQDITFDFLPDAIDVFNNYAADGYSGFGFDPDCHFYNDGISLDVETSPVPEPATMLLLGTGLLVLGGFRKRLKMKR